VVKGFLVAMLCAVCFLAGGFVGVQAGMTNAHIDFCADDTSGRFIADPSIRAEVCQL
jgi:hypothetical protein